MVYDLQFIIYDNTTVHYILFNLAMTNKRNIKITNKYKLKYEKFLKDNFILPLNF